MSFVTAKVAVKTYCTPADVTNILNLSFTTTTVPTIAQVIDLIVRASSYVDQVSGHNWRLNTATEVYDASGTGPRAGTIILRNRPLINVTSAYYWDPSLRSGAGDWNTTTAQGYPTQFPNSQTYFVYQPEAKIQWFKLRLDDRLRYQVIYTYGYVTPPDFVRDLTSVITAMDVLVFWGSQLGIQEDLSLMKQRLEQKKLRLEARCATTSAAFFG